MGYHLLVAQKRRSRRRRGEGEVNIGDGGFESASYIGNTPTRQQHATERARKKGVEESKMKRKTAQIIVIRYSKVPNR